MPQDHEILVALTADIVSAHVSNNAVAMGDVPTSIPAVYSALASLGAPAAEPVPEKPKGAVSSRASLKPEHLISMIDGKPYRMLKRHLAGNGYTPQAYREAFGLPKDYPMVAPNYAAQRRELAIKIGLGRKPAKKTPRKPKS
jgi:predicted transcriptional regulator